MQNATVKKHVYYHEAIVDIVEPAHTGKAIVLNSKGKRVKSKHNVKIPECRIYSKDVHFFDDKKITLKSKQSKLDEILAHLQLNLKINDRYRLKFKEIIKTKKL